MFQSLIHLQAAISRYVADHNASPEPLIWAAGPDTIIAVISRGYHTSIDPPGVPRIEKYSAFG